MAGSCLLGRESPVVSSGARYDVALKGSAGSSTMRLSLAGGAIATGGASGIAGGAKGAVAGGGKLGGSCMLGGANGATGMAFGLICLLGTVIGADSIGTGG